MPDPDRVLATYLRDHLAGSVAGKALAGRISRENPTNHVGTTLGAIEQELEAEQRALLDIMQRLGVSPNQFKMVMARGAELLGRFKANGTIARYSPSSLVLELEGLLGGVTVKRGLWKSLLGTIDARPELDATTLEQLIGQAISQLDRLTAAHEWASRRAFGATTSPIANQTTAH